jgi:hypothetical protein
MKSDKKAVYSRLLIIHNFGPSFREQNVWGRDFGTVNMAFSRIFCQTPYKTCKWA